MMRENPYTLVFGKEPEEMIARHIQTNMVLDAFRAEHPNQQVYIITGPRGSGKTVLMTEISRRLKESDGWIVTELNPERDMLQTLASKLASENVLAQIFQEAKINLSFFGIGAEITGAAPIRDIEVALTRMIESLKKKGKRLLITIDEAVGSQNMKIFAGSFQIFLRQNLPVFLLMTGLFENIRLLQDEKTLTFLYRAPRIELRPLNIGTIADNYRRNLPVDEETALDMAKLTRGYAFAFQVLGYFCFEKQELTEEVLQNFKQYLQDYVYEKIWSELSQRDRELCYAISKSGSDKISEIRQIMGIDTNHFSPYRKRLIDRGILQGDTRGHVRFILPLFENYVIENYEAV